MAQQAAGHPWSRTGMEPAVAVAGGQHAWLAALVDSSFDAILSKTLDGTITSWNAAAERMYGYPAAEAIGRSIEFIVPADRLEELQAMDAQLARGERVLPFETVRLTRDGRQIDVQLTMSPILDAQGAVVGASGIGRDISERRQAEHRQRRLIEELNHRVNNTLAIAQSLATQSLHHSPSPEHFAAAFRGRLAALADVHTLLAAAGWEGARLHDLLRVQIAPYRTPEGSDVRIQGQDVALEPNAVLALGLALHELTANAATHGALASPSGRIDISTQVLAEGGRRRLVLTWRERGGPPVREARRSGFGGVMIERGLAYQLTATVALEFRPAGVRCRIELPLADAGPPPIDGWPAEAET
jgi:two-component system, chemotaxis family, CheB/CheR fusion protein